LTCSESKPSAISSHGGFFTFPAPAHPTSGQLEKFFVAVGFAGGNQTLVGKELQHRVHRTGAGPPQSVAEFENLLDYLVAVHGPLAQQYQEGRTHINASTAATPATPPAGRPAWAETKAEARRKNRH
jgi:hypothetical protein